MSGEEPTIASLDTTSVKTTQNGHEESKSGETRSKETSMDAAEFFGRLQPFLEQLIDLYSKASPYINNGLKMSRKYYSQYLEPYTKDIAWEEVANIALGIVLLIFGGQFAMTIACYTALQISGWSTVKDSYRKIREQYNAGRAALDSDERAKKMLDTDGDGKISAEEVGDFGRRWLAANRAERMEILSNFRGILVSIDPYEVMNGMTGIWAVFVTLLATLRSSFAKDVALGVSLGKTLSSCVSKYVKPLVASAAKVDAKMKPWADFCVESVCKMIGISLALMLVRMVSAFHSAVQGGAILAAYLFKFLKNKDLAPAGAKEVEVEKTEMFVLVQMLCAGYGFYYQLSNGFALNSILLRLVLFPFVLLESVLTFLAAYN